MRSLKTGTTLLVMLLACTPALSATDPDAVLRALEQVNQRLEALEQQNRQLSQRVDELTQQNQALRSASPVTAAPVVESEAVAPVVAAPRDGWESRIRLGGDFRFRHERIDNEALENVRRRETIRARVSAAIRVNESINGEIGLGTGGRDPRGGSATLGDGSSRKDIGLDLAYMTWHPVEELAFTVGKMREPYVRPGRSQFFDNEIRPEGIAVNYKDSRGLFGTAYRFWLEERPLQGDSTLLGGQAGWDGKLGSTSLRAGVGYYDYQNVRGRFPGFGNGLLNELGNTIDGTGTAARYVYDYDIGQLFVDATLPVAGIPLNLFADYGHNFAADNGLDTAYSVGLLVGRANVPGRWEAGVTAQKVEKDALFGHWTDSDFGGGVTDNDGYVWRVGWMAMQGLLVDLVYLDTRFNVDVGEVSDYDRWQINFNFTF